MSMIFSDYISRPIFDVRWDMLYIYCACESEKIPDVGSDHLHGRRGGRGAIIARAWIHSTSELGTYGYLKFRYNEKLYFLHFLLGNFDWRRLDNLIVLAQK